MCSSVLGMLAGVKCPVTQGRGCCRAWVGLGAEFWLVCCASGDTAMHGEGRLDAAMW